MQPAFPVIIFGQTPRKLLWVAKATEQVQVASLLGFLQAKPGTEVFFDSANRIWHRKVETVNHYGALRRLLAYTFYNPKHVAVRNEWLLQGDYTLAELKARTKACIEEDDDVLTQFVEAEKLSALIDQAATYAAVVEVLTQPFHEDYQYINSAR